MRLFRRNSGSDRSPPPHRRPGILAGLLQWHYVSTRKSLDALLELRAFTGPDDPIVTADGGLMSMLRFDGCRRLGGADHLASLAEALAGRLAGALRQPGHAIHIVYERDPGGGLDVMRSGLADPRASARALELDLGDVLDDRERTLAPHLAPEHCHLAVWTRATCLSGAAARDALRAARARDLQEGPREDAPLDGVITQHEAIVRDLVDSLPGLDLVGRRLTAPETIAVIRGLLTGCPIVADTGPYCAGPGFAPVSADAPWDGLTNPDPPSLLLAADPVVEGGLVHSEGRVWAPVVLQRGPVQPTPFTRFLDTVPGLPVRQSILIESGWGTAAALKQAAASILAVAGHENRLIRDQLETLRHLSVEGTPVVRLSMTWATWADTAQLARQRRDELRQAVEAWGNQATSIVSGDPLSAWASTVAGLGAFTTSPRAIAPLAAALALAPLQRPAPARERGAAVHLMAAHGGKPVSQPVLAGGEHSFELVSGEPGKGKSVLLNARALATVLEGGQQELPRMAVLDVGGSAAGLISLLQAALPAGRRDDVVFHRLQNRRDHAINPFDTPLGCRHPPAHQVGFLANLVAAMIRPEGAAALPEGMDTLVPEVIAEVYRMRADDDAQSEPNLYQPGIDRTVDRALRGLGLPQEPTWWQAVDLLFAAGRLAEAASAQRWAVPVLADLTRAAQSDAIKDSHSAITLASGESAAQALVRTIGAVHRVYSALAGRTALNLGAARIAVLDLGDVADPHSPRRTAIMYLAARQLLTSDWFITPEDVARMPHTVRDWHAARVRGLAEVEKLLQYDEFHRTGGVPELIAQVGLDAREGRKFRRRVVLASQRLEDFDPSLIALASRVWVLGADNPDSQAEVIRLFRLDGGAATAVRRQLTGPGRNGAPALVLTYGSERGQEQLARTVVGPIELWALTTQPYDAALRQRLYARLRPRAARQALAEWFPDGTCRFPDRLAAAGGAVSESRLLDDLADEIASKVDYRQHIEVAA